MVCNKVFAEPFVVPAELHTISYLADSQLPIGDVTDFF
jgi:hypothetical protein